MFSAQVYCPLEQVWGMVMKKVLSTQAWVANQGSSRTLEASSAVLFIGNTRIIQV